MKTIALTFRQAKYDLLSFRRNPVSAFFTFVFPLMFLVIFNLVFGDDQLEVPGGKVSASTFYVPAIVALSVINACYTNMAMSISLMRDRGMLKRVRGTPLPSVAFLGGRILQAITLAIILVVIVLALGTLAYGVDINGSRMPAFILTLAVSAGCFCALGLAVASLVPDADAAPAVVQASILPLLFISNVFIPTANSPQWLNDFASLFPVVHAANGLQDAFNPFRASNGADLKDLLVLLGWGVGAVLFSVRYFNWEPKR